MLNGGGPVRSSGMNPIVFGGTYVNFSVSGIAIPGVDYVPLVSGLHRTIRLRSNPGPNLADPRASSLRQPYSVVVMLEPGAGYAVGEPSSAQMMIRP